MNTIWNAVVPGSSSQAEPQTSKKVRPRAFCFWNLSAVVAKVLRWDWKSEVSHW
jgi:hypothetical protein